MTLVSGATPVFKLIAVKTRIRVQISRRTSRQSGGEVFLEFCTRQITQSTDHDQGAERCNIRLGRSERTNQTSPPCSCAPPRTIRAHCNGKNERSSGSRICASQSLGHTMARASGLEGTFILIEFRSSAAEMFHAQSKPRQTASVANRLLLNMAG